MHTWSFVEVFGGGWYRAGGLCRDSNLCLLWAAKPRSSGPAGLCLQGTFWLLCQCWPLILPWQSHAGSCWTLPDEAVGSQAVTAASHGPSTPSMVRLTVTTSSVCSTELPKYLTWLFPAAFPGFRMLCFMLALVFASLSFPPVDKSCFFWHANGAHSSLSTDTNHHLRYFQMS